MECPICGSEMLDEGVYGRIAVHQDGKVFGRIFRCPKGMEQDGACDSEVFYVAGSFYTDLSGKLNEGYPC